MACLWCGKRLVGAQRKWCSATHRVAASQAKARGRLPKGSGWLEGDAVKPAPGLDMLEVRRLRGEGLTFSQIGAALGFAASTVSRAVMAEDQEARQEAKRAGWVPPERLFPENLWELAGRDLRALLRDFLWFQGTFFQTERGSAPMVPRFHRRWILRILKALVTGGRLVILSPPRHGKTELLIRFCVWLIARFPNIRIIWVGGNEDLAKQALASILDHLENNEDLIRAFCPPGKAFKPSKKQGGRWSQSAFEVATRTVTGIKQPTMRAVGRGGRLRSQDTDFIVNDDIEDEKSTVQPVTREETRRWWTTGPDSRKEEHTALFYIGSRAHPDDLGGHLLENDEYDSVVEHAHDPACLIDPVDVEAHVECMLFPQLRSYRWLMQQKTSSETVGGAAIFDMLYQNLPTGEGFDTFTAEAVHPCRNEGRIVGQLPEAIGDTGGISLVAGLDPAGTGYQAAFLWAYQVVPELRISMVDLENHEGGGIAQARATVRDWYEKYRLSHWVVEENLYQGGIVDDEILTAFRQNHGITMESFRTYRNKIDPRLGVTSLVPLFANHQIDLPYGDTASRVKVDAYVRQLLHYDGRAPRNRNTRAGYKSDLVMASWFPMDVIRRAQQDYIAEMGVDYAVEERFFAGDDINDFNWGDGDWLAAG